MKRRLVKVIGWREWVSLPELEVIKIKVKVDSGARTSSLHAFDMKVYKRGQKQFVKFKLHPMQRTSKGELVCSAEIVEFRKVKSSNGSSELRPVILTTVSLMGEEWDTEVTLTNRDEMGFRMLLGRESIRKKFLVDVGKSFLALKKNNGEEK